jgi:hypothetical protein
LALRDFTTRQMRRVTARWLGALLPKIESVGGLVGSAYLLRRAHAGLGIPAKSPPEPDPVAPIIAQQRARDSRHDRLGRGAIFMLRAYAELAEDEREQRGYLARIETLFPAGPSTFNLAYEEEAGAVDILESVLASDPALEAELAALPLRGGGALLDAIKEHIRSGRELGELEDQKRALLAEPAASDESRLSEARLFWIRAVKNFLGTLSLVEMPGEDRAALLAPVRGAEEVVARRRRGEAVAEEPEEDDALALGDPGG